ncbi:GNAT family N-acetyltransferase [Dickeya dadantii subsp. dieffenbachiae]|uniref:Putative acetyltransferase n=1 Tax=Dickeya dadantii (strain 3937) TaxID=198628 RepID=E0SEM0_DICD3|nr:GNAT family N-acetyltransferase [Dickeya dadantii]ADM96273.1 putative acetyltransferase [Dickeya dadantii 3937]
MSLVDFTPADYPRLIRWVDSAELNLLWGGPTYSFPLTATQITDHLANPQFVPYLFEHQGDIVGFVELSQVEPHHSRLCRVFIDPAYRGRGLARAMLQAAIRQAVERFEAQAVSLSVFIPKIIRVAGQNAWRFEQRNALALQGKTHNESCNAATQRISRSLHQ